MLTLFRRLLELALAAFVVGVLLLAVIAATAPLAGYGLYAVRSASMAPAIHVGDLVVARRVDAATVQPGDVITMMVGTGATLTHRVVAVTPNDSGPVFTTQGDANATPDPVATLADQVRGVVVWQLPLLGFLLAMVTMPSGIAALFSIGGTMLTAIWLLDEVEAGDDDEELAELARRVEAGQTALS